MKYDKKIQEGVFKHPTSHKNSFATHCHRLILSDQPGVTCSVAVELQAVGTSLLTYRIYTTSV
jgi:hypothetical protein